MCVLPLLRLPPTPPALVCCKLARQPGFKLKALLYTFHSQSNFETGFAFKPAGGQLCTAALTTLLDPKDKVTATSMCECIKYFEISLVKMPINYKVTHIHITHIFSWISFSRRYISIHIHIHIHINIYISVFDAIVAALPTELDPAAES